MQSLKTDNLVAFEQSRRVTNSHTLCYAPELSLNFEQNGSVTACCFNRTYVLGKYPADSLTEIWSGEKIKLLRERLRERDLSLGCQSCAKVIQEGNFESVLIKHFDDFAGFADNELKIGLLDKVNALFGKSKRSDLKGPKVLEFELGNTCNLECIMCGGKWSSSIRKNRENLPELSSPYDDEFVEQLRYFASGLKRVNFLGGEPFLIKIYYKIWDVLIEENPDIVVAVTSNGTILNNRVKNIITKLNNCKLTLSIDSLRKETWEKIRLKGNFESLMANMNWFLDSKKLVSFSVCPMIQNWREIPEIIEFCLQHKLDIYFNVVYGPLGGKIDGIHKKAGADSYVVPETSLQALSYDELNDVIDFYKEFEFTGRQGVQFNNLIKQLQNWLLEKK